VIAILALFLALSEAGAKKADHISTEKNIESSDLFNFYQAKKIRSTIVETASQTLESQMPGVSDPKAHDALEKQVAAFKTKAAEFEHDPKKPEDSLDAIQDRANEAGDARELANLIFDHAEGKPLNDETRNRLASRASVLKLETITPYFGSLERDPVHPSAYYLAVDGIGPKPDHHAQPFNSRRTTASIARIPSSLSFSAGR